MRILIVTQMVDSEDPTLGFFHGWIREFARSCTSVQVICLREGEHQLPQNVSVHTLGKERGATKLGYIISFYRFIWTLRHEYDVVFVHMNPEYVVLGGIPWRLMRKRVALWYVHKSVTWKLRVAEKLVHKILTANIESFRLRTRKLLVLGHGIPTDIFSENRLDVPGVSRICTLGRVSATKRIMEMADAVVHLVDSGLACTFTIVGGPVTEADKRYERELKDRYANNSEIVFAGPLPYTDLPAFLATQNLLLNASMTGSLDKAILDALAARVPVISSNEAVRDILEPHSLFIESPEAKSFEKAIRAYSTRQDTNEISKVLRSFVVEGHSLRHLVPAILKAY